MRLMALFLALSSLFLCMPSQARAGYDLKKGLIPSKYYGQWASPSCEAPNGVVTIYGRLILDATSETNLTYRITKTAMSGDIFAAQVSNLTFFMNNLTDNSVTIMRHYSDQPGSNTAPITEKIHTLGVRYTKCDTVEAEWPSLTPVGIDAAEKIYKLEKACNGAYIEDSPQCQQDTFTFFDEDHDGLLGRTELERAYELAVFFGSSIGCFFPHHYTSIIKTDATAFAEDTIGSMDQDKDYKLSLNEIITGFETAKLQRSFIRFMDYTNDLAVLLYTLPHYPYIER